MTMRLGRHGEWSDLLSDGIGAALAVGVAAVWRPANPAAAPAAGQRAVAGAGPAATLSRRCRCPGPRPKCRLRARARTIKALAAPGLYGRGYVKQGEHLAAAYLRERLTRS